MINWLKKIGLFILYFYVYYFLVALVSLIPLSLIDKATNTTGTDSGLWAYGIILGFVLAPVLSFLTVTKKNNNKKVNNIIKWSLIIIFMIVVFSAFFIG